MTIIILIIGLASSVTVNVLSIAAAGRLIGAPLDQIKLFSGPRLIRIKMGNASLCVHAVPIGGCVKFQDDLVGVHPLKQVFIVISGCLGLFVAAIFVLGVSEALEQFASGFYQIVAGALAPSTRGAKLISAAYEFLKANAFLLCLGSVAAKLAAGNLLPVPALNGGDAVLYLVNWFMPLASETRERIRLVGSIFVAMLGICWLVAFYFFVVGHLV